MSSVFDDIKVIGESEDPEWIAVKLEQMKDPDVQSVVATDTNLEQGDKGILEFLNLVQDQPWMYATHKFGYIAPRQSDSMEPLLIQHPSAIVHKADRYEMLPYNYVIFRVSRYEE